ncbi:hypothetical protein KKH14_01350 [Patescibacteria group bacterium]|nr:hypothetical protein [Patescibacteria group bacterium]
MKRHNKKYFAIFFIALILLSAVPKPALAQLATFEANPALWLSSLLSWGLDILSEYANTASLAQSLLEWAFKIAAEALKRQLLNMIVDQIVQWIQGGGEPKFITDWPGFFRDAVDQAGGRFIQKIGLSQLCSPFKAQLSAAFIPIPTFTDRSSCTFSQIGVNIDSFLKGFENGGWIAWQEMVLKPQNNIYGAYLMAWDQYEIEKSAADKAASAEAQAGKGFLGVRGGCIERNYEGYQSCIESGASAEECDEASCIRRETITPGAAVGDLTAKAIGSDIDYIVNAQDFAAYIGAIVNALLNRMFAEGVGLLHAGVSGVGGSGGGKTPQELCAPFSGTPDYDDCLDALEQCVPLSDTPDYKTCAVAAQCAPLSDTPNYEDCIITEAKCNALLDTPAYDDCIITAKSGKNIIDSQIEFMIFKIDQDLGYQKKLLEAKKATLNVLNESIDILNQLKNCQGTAPDALVQVQSDVATVKGQITEIQSTIIDHKTLKDKIKTITDVSQIGPFQAQVTKDVHPGTTQGLVVAAEEETAQKEEEKNFYQEKLDTCLATH